MAKAVRWLIALVALATASTSFFGHGVISGEFTREETQELALLLIAGALPAMLTVVEQRTIGAH